MGLVYDATSQFILGHRRQRPSFVVEWLCFPRPTAQDDDDVYEQYMDEGIPLQGLEGLSPRFDSKPSLKLQLRFSSPHQMGIVIPDIFGDEVNAQRFMSAGARSLELEFDEWSDVPHDLEFGLYVGSRCSRDKPLFLTRISVPPTSYYRF